MSELLHLRVTDAFTTYVDQRTNLRAITFAIRLERQRALDGVLPRVEEDVVEQLRMNWPDTTEMPPLLVRGDVPPDDARRVGALVVNAYQARALDAVGGRALYSDESVSLEAFFDSEPALKRARKVSNVAFAILLGSYRTFDFPGLISGGPDPATFGD